MHQLQVVRCMEKSYKVMCALVRKDPQPKVIVRLQALRESIEELLSEATSERNADTEGVGLIQVSASTRSSDRAEAGVKMQGDKSAEAGIAFTDRRKDGAFAVCPSEMFSKRYDGTPGRRVYVFAHERCKEQGDAPSSQASALQTPVSQDTSTPERLPIRAIRIPKLTRERVKLVINRVIYEKVRNEIDNVTGFQLDVGAVQGGPKLAKAVSYTHLTLPTTPYV